ncbi:MAG: hypothetical protein FVQ80_11175 [Planctomycetes bacterium]|nr:hypothetical protein [Planctomycetota bacterium]
MMTTAEKIVVNLNVYGLITELLGSDSAGLAFLEIFEYVKRHTPNELTDQELSKMIDGYELGDFVKKDDDDLK